MNIFSFYYFDASKKYVCAKTIELVFMEQILAQDNITFVEQVLLHIRDTLLKVSQSIKSRKLMVSVFYLRNSVYIMIPKECHKISEFRDFWFLLVWRTMLLIYVYQNLV
ncbi:unnamed protein product (macronuclear) [Paramecium tetraurelia]|uniref:Uncharacterized protein n=1 Tax=Paramecium tetraurelia TaxID=5888 RepID=A0CGA6_PARTE|nr:uncharacterized protein GSPATT00038268001 [Paramecium tetraurelia]CAK69823.1 unnamed protein product [Paramecium tetraurelia]|eukprot:XP_001437220.1 hypothetical protein (macronuclear) [Paramecium tetraurelia strain d4-2]